MTNCAIQYSTGRVRWPILPAMMVEKNHDEERFARIEQMIETLQQEPGTLRTATGKMIDVGQVSLKRDAIRRRRRTDAFPLPRLRVVER
jgi:hypothetical protein